MNAKNSFVAIGGVIVGGILLATLLQPRSAVTAQSAVTPARPQTGATPLLAGKLISVSVWTQPIETYKGTNHSEIFKDGQVAIYDRFMVVTRPNGDQRLVWHGYHSDLWFRAE